MRKVSLAAATLASLSNVMSGYAVAAAPNYNDIQTVVVIYAENWSFDALFGRYPGANGLSRATPASYTQIDRDGSTMSGLPAVWGGTASGITAGAPAAPRPLTQAETATYLNTFNHPFTMDALYGSQTTLDTNPLRYTTRDLYHRFYENQMQINGGANNMYAAWADSGGLTMAYYNNNMADHPLWALAQKNVLADNFFQSAFGGSYLNHQYLICSCAPIYPDDGNGKPYNPATQATTVYSGTAHLSGAAGSSTAPADSVVISGGTSGTVPTLKTSGTSPASALTGPPAFVNSSVLTPMLTVNGASHFWSVNTSQPPFPPSSNAANASGAQTEIKLNATSTLPPQNQTNIGDLLTAKGVDWAYYSGAWNFAQAHAPFANETTDNINADPNFQYHHQPFNYFDRFDPNRPAGKTIQRDSNGYPVYSGTYSLGGGNTWSYVSTTDARYTNSGATERSLHLKDAGVYTRSLVNSASLDTSSQFYNDINNGTLPPVTFYKPHGTVNEHPGYANVADGDNHIAAVVAKLQASPQYAHMLIVITYDEFGGQWDHVSPPKGDTFGPGTRIPAIIVSPYAKKGFVDHAQYDTTSILRFISNWKGLTPLAGITLRDTALTTNGGVAMGDLTNALVLQ